MTSFVFKNIILSPNGNQLRTDEGILCAFEDENGKEKIMFVPEHSITSHKNGNVQAESSSSKPEVNKASTSTLPPSLSKGEKVEWNDGDTKMLLDNYAEYLGQVGPLKKFKTKKCMWDQISRDILKKLNIQRTSAQCENRYKTILKRKSAVNKINKTSGNSPKKEPFADEIQKIKAIDDSVEPEVLLGVDKCLVKNTIQNIKIVDNSTSEPPKKKNKSTSLSYLLKELHEDKENRKEIRHKEKLEMIKSLLSKD